MSENGHNSKKIELSSSITVRDLAQIMQTSPIDVIKALMSNGVMASINQPIDFDTAAIVASEMGFEAVPESPKVTEQDLGEIPQWRKVIAKEAEQNLSARPPVVTILGHVDHGKTTLLDAVRETNVAEGEVGGITQHIGAYQAEHNGHLITFLDTPGHAAFTAMRARGAQGADIVILVVAADDGVMPQTKEAIAHAKAAKVPIIVAMNKIDKANADQDRVKQQLAEAELVPDEWDGDTIVVPLSAKRREGLEDLLEAIVLVADNMDIRANPNGEVIGTVIEAELDKAKGAMATFLVQNGTLEVGDVVVVGKSFGKLKALFDFRGRRIRKAGPSTPVSVMGLNEVPQAGDLFQVVPSEREARVIVTENAAGGKSTTSNKKAQITLEQLFDQFQAGEVHELKLIIKADVQGSLEPIISSLKDLCTEALSVNILYAETGNITENDVMLAAASKAVIVGFSVQADVAARRVAEKEGVSIRLYDIIYRMIEDIEKALNGMLEPVEKETVLGHAEVRRVFRISKVGNIAGCYVTDGEIRRNLRGKVLRSGEIVAIGEISSIKHLQEDVKEIRQGFECGISIRNFDDFNEGDKIECVLVEKVPAA
ncbi:MAG: translation initiation factor IF-2 [Anaerolineales bacterium]|nr:MAG: translation initiation factor IF-2 [Anaerolineales bacterium]